mgnify:CR=1 FL=1
MPYTRLVAALISLSILPATVSAQALPGPGAPTPMMPPPGATPEQIEAQRQAMEAQQKAQQEAFQAQQQAQQKAQQEAMQRQQEAVQAQQQAQQEAMERQQQAAIFYRHIRAQEPGLSQFLPRFFRYNAVFFPLIDIGRHFVGHKFF